jgi:hypothetical protein
MTAGRPETTASVLAKIVLAAIGFALTLAGVIIRAIGVGGLLSTEPKNPGLAKVGAWVLLVGAIWMLITIGAWLAAPRTWTLVAPYTVGVFLGLAILGNLLLSAALTLTGRHAIIDPTEGVGWRTSLTVGVLAIAIAQWAVASALQRRPEPITSGMIIRLRLSAASVLVLGLIAAWTTPVSIVAALTMAALIYIAIELVPR